DVHRPRHACRHRRRSPAVRGPGCGAGAGCRAADGPARAARRARAGLARPDHGTDLRRAADRGGPRPAARRGGAGHVPRARPRRTAGLHGRCLRRRRRLRRQLRLPGGLRGGGVPGRRARPPRRRPDRRRRAPGLRRRVGHHLHAGRAVADGAPRPAVDDGRRRRRGAVPARRRPQGRPRRGGPAGRVATARRPL
ncbi:MAG: Substrate-specific component BioY of biotin ECF transporter, partial [uncultured Thermoleophilia bacterium]